MLTIDKDKLDGIRTYIDGKMKRYDLLFAVNGGAFVIGQLKPEDLGNLDVRALAIGSILFTVVMTVDIWIFAERLKRDFFESKENVFTWAGKIILWLLGTLLILAWGLAAKFSPIYIIASIVGLLVCSLIIHWWIVKHPLGGSGPEGVHGAK